MHISQDKQKLIEFLKEKALWVRRQTLMIHKIAPETRLASSLSDVEIFVALYYGGILKFTPNDINWHGRDRFIVSKGHGAISLYPVLADLGYFPMEELKRVCKEDSFLGGIPDIIIPGFETTNGSLGQGLGVACGMAVALKREKSDAAVFVLIGDGELYEGSVWESIMFAAEHKLDNLTIIIDNNKICMLDYCRNIIDLTPLEKKFRTFNWKVKTIDGHDVKKIYNTLHAVKTDRSGRPKAVIADTVKGRGVPQLEGDSLCHIRSMKEDEINNLLEWRK